MEPTNKITTPKKKKISIEAESKIIDFELIKKLFKLKNKDNLLLYLETILPEYCSFDHDINVGISKTKFINFMKLPFFIGEKIFYSLNYHTSEYLPANTFSHELCNLYYGNFEEVATFIFDVYDFDYDGFIIPSDVKLIFSHLTLKVDKNLLNYELQMESLAQAEELIEESFGEHKRLNLENFLKITKEKPIIFFQLLCYLYQNCPFSEDNLRFLSKTNQNTVNGLPSVSNNIENNFNYYNVDENFEYLIIDDNDNKNQKTLNYTKHNDKVSKNFRSKSIDLKIIKLISKSDLFRHPIQQFMVSSLLELNSPKKISNYSSICVKKKRPNFESSDSISRSNEEDNKNRIDELEEQIKAQSQELISDYASLSNINTVKRFSSADNYERLSRLISKNLGGINGKVRRTSAQLNKIRLSVNNITYSLKTVNRNKKFPEINDINEILESSENKDENNNSNFDHLINFEGEVYQKSERKQNTVIYWLVLIGTDLYYYSDSSKNYLLKMKNLQGCFVSEVIAKKIKNNKFYRFQIKYLNKTRNYFTLNEEKAKHWVRVLRKTLGLKNFYENYKIIEDIGSGSYGSVKLGYNIKTNQKVAIKKISKSKFSQERLNFIKSEIDILKFCKHPNIVEFLEHFENSDYIFIITEYIKYGDLREYISIKKHQNKVVLESRAAMIAYQVADVLKYLHKFGIVHRDIKPENIVVEEYEKNKVFKIKLLDFGLSKVLGQKEFSRERYGTLSYVPPCIIKGEPYNILADIWSFGVFLYHILSGSLPFNSKTRNNDEIATNIVTKELTFNHKSWQSRSNECKELIKKCLHKEYAKRITAEEILKDPWFSLFQAKKLCSNQVSQISQVSNLTQETRISQVSQVSNSTHERKESKESQISQVNQGVNEDINTQEK